MGKIKIMLEEMEGFDRNEAPISVSNSCAKKDLWSGKTDFQESVGMQEAPEGWIDLALDINGNYEVLGIEFTPFHYREGWFRNKNNYKDYIRKLAAWIEYKRTYRGNEEIITWSVAVDKLFFSHVKNFKIIWKKKEV